MRSPDGPNLELRIPFLRGHHVCLIVHDWFMTVHARANRQWQVMIEQKTNAVVHDQSRPIMSTIYA